MKNSQDTIVAPATAPGGAIAVVRISGPRAVACCSRIFRTRKPISEAPGYTVHYGRIVDRERVIDDVLATIFRAPNSYTGEEAVEISCHGSKYIVAEIIRLLLDAGARLADPGEFTLRAYLAGKIDLAQAEAVADLIAAESKAAHAIASAQMRGGYSDELNELREKIVNLTALLELELDFADEEVEFADRNVLRDTMVQIGREIDRLVGSFALGNAIKEGVPVAIVGAPNVGKSTLLNRLVNEERAMVSDIAGTTRDVIEETLDIDGVRFRFLDTAGIRNTEDPLEQMGIERTMASIDRARIVVRLLDGSRMPDGARTGGLIPVPEFPIGNGQSVLTVVNKCDICERGAFPEGVLVVSAKRGEGIEELRRALRAEIDTDGIEHGATVVSNSRHYEALTAARKALRAAIEALDSGAPTDLLSEEIRQVIVRMGEITGEEISSDDILKHIFSKFCIGK